VKKPREIFDRDAEWAALSRFARSPGTHGQLGLVYGRRRQGKSWLLERVAERARGRYWEAIEGTARQQLDHLARALSGWKKLPAAPVFATWAEALDALWKASPRLLVLDEFQYLLDSSPELPSLLQARVSRRTGPRVILCGSALGAMRSLLAADAPLRGRASLELVVRPFDYRIAARYWRLGSDLSRALRLHALLGGTPAYLDFTGGRTPAEYPRLDDWIADVLLDPAGALFREGRILTDERTLVDRGLYHGILAAVAGGATRRGQIASVVGRPDNTMAHALGSLVDLGLLERLADPLHGRRSCFRLAEPLLRTYETLIAPNERALERRGARRLWRALVPVLSSQIFGPHFEHLAREWVQGHASEASLGGTPKAVGPSTVSDPAAQKERELDVVATEGSRVIAIGEAKWSGSALGRGVLAELERKRSLLGPRASTARLLLFGSSGFERGLAALARGRDDVVLVDLRRLYLGD